MQRIDRREVLGDGLKLPSQERGATSAATDLAAGGFGDRADPDQYDDVEGQAVDFKDAGADRFENRGQIAVVVARDFLDQDQSRRRGGIDVVHEGKRRSATGLDQFVRRLGGGLQILRIVVQAADDDQVVDTPGHKKVATAREAKVTCAKEFRFGELRMGRTKGLQRLGRVSPVTVSHRRPGHPYFAHAVIAQPTLRFRIDNRHAKILQWRTGGCEAVGVSLVGGRFDAVL